MEKYDAIIIGFGKGGKTLSVELAKRGWKVAMVERSSGMYGGTCINIGCIPTKTLVHLAKEAEQHQFKSFEQKADFYRQSMEKKEKLTTALRDKNYHNLADRELIKVIDGIGSFVDDNHIKVNSGETSLVLEANHIFINTGAESITPNIEGAIDTKGVYNSTSLLNLHELPRRLIIVGGGYIGLEFASMYASFGSEVIVLEGSARLIAREDSDIATAVQARLEQRGVRFITQARTTRLEETKGKVTVHYTQANAASSLSLEADAVLLATGRRPATTDLNLSVVGVETDERGAIRVDEQLRTTNPHIFALGDVRGGQQFTYLSLDDFRIVRDALFGQSKRNTTDRSPVSYSVFIDPPLARIGINEDEARQQGLSVRIKRLAVAAIPRAKTLGETEGILKVLVDDTDQIVGCTLFCPEASELINTVALVMKQKLPYTVLRDLIYTHPSMSESFNDLFQLD